MHYTTNTKSLFHRVYACLEKTWAKTPLPRQNRIVIIFWKRVFKQAVGEAERKSEIAAIFNKYKDILDNFIHSSDTESPDRPDSLNRPGLIDKRSHNTPRSRSDSSTFLEEDCLDENVPVMSLELVPKIQASQVHQCHDVVSLGPKSKRAQYANSQKGGEDRKGKRGRENRKG